ncbi:hypothetical protein BDV30DRAFT_202014 [Aspergillus minisclerotigenes]|uniref:Uncharacterized protein n=1 Tax=Aspergillus minisclerotigenes TaxID=656917 RepID=A0A5N6JPJ2_9EURO|nr:hypothetical protein BDV30DRAFT_202014 [Aspergillus minisclerotigenes]
MLTLPSLSKFPSDFFASQSLRPTLWPHIGDGPLGMENVRVLVKWWFRKLDGSIHSLGFMTLA